MKQLLIFFLLGVMFWGCSDKENCLRAKGVSASRHEILHAFTEVDIPKGVDAEIIPSDTYRIEILSYENRIEGIEVKNEGQKLLITNTNSCDILHDYKVATLRIFAPNITKIISRTQFRLYSIKTLTYPELYVVTSLSEKSGSSEVDLKIDNQVFTVEDNKVGYFKLSGKTRDLRIELYGGNGRVEAQRLTAENVYVFHRSVNNVYVFPVQKIEGTLYSTGNLVLYNQPQEVKVTTMYSGKVLYD